MTALGSIVRPAIGCRNREAGLGGEGQQAPVRLSSLLNKSPGPVKAGPAGSGEIAPAVENPTLSQRKNERIDRYDDRLFLAPFGREAEGAPKFQLQYCL